MCYYKSWSMQILHPHAEVVIKIQFSIDTFSFNESDGSGYVEVTASRAPDSDFMFTLSQSELGFSQYLSLLPAWSLATVQCYNN